MAKPAKDQNRAASVLRESWGVFARNGSVRTRPEHPVLRELTEKWDEQLTNGEKRILLQDAIKRLCAPPYGANIASAGLFLGVFVAPRSEKLSVVKSGKSVSITEWIQDRVFRGNFIDVSSLHDVELIFSGDSSSEWEILLDEWEIAETYSAQRNYYIRAEELKKRIPLPTALTYREIHLEDLGTKAAIEIKNNEDKQNTAINRIEDGLQHSDVGKLSWGTVDLYELIFKMESEKALWSDHEIEKIKPIAERARQSLIQMFPDWLENQAPKDGSPDSVGHFKHLMIHKIGENLHKLKLYEQQEALNRKTLELIRRVELITSAHQIVRDIRLWLISNAQATNFIRISELRAIQKVGKDYVEKLNNISRHLNMTEIAEVKIQLIKRLKEIKEVLKKIKDRALRLWQTKIKTYNDAEELQNEVNELFSIYEGCKEDIDDLQIMRRSLRMYIQAYRQLNNDLLTWDEFISLSKKTSLEVQKDLGEDEPPWEPLETIENLRKDIEMSRMKKSREWILSLERDIENIEDLNTTDINIIYTRANNPPAILSEEHRSQLNEIYVKLEGHLNKLKVEWLVEKFNELNSEMQKQFLSKISS